MFCLFDHRFLEFIRLFNAREYWKSHEALEKLWLERREDPNRIFYKGLIQLAAALYHVEKANFRGAWPLYESAGRYVALYPSRHLGIDRIPLMDSMRVFIEGREKEGSRTQAERPIISTAFGTE